MLPEPWLYLAAASFGLAAKPSLVKQLEKDNTSEIWKVLSKPEYTIPLGVGLLVATALIIWWIVGTWRGRRWALWLHVLFSGPGVILGFALQGSPFRLILPFVVALYCFLRLTGYVGPKAKKKRSK